MKATKYVGKKQGIAHMSLTDHPNSQRSLEISPIWTSIIAADVKKKYNSAKWCLNRKIG
jgi:hypothetical protein